MISMIWSALWSRRWRALAVAVLAGFRGSDRGLGAGVRGRLGKCDDPQRDRARRPWTSSAHLRIRRGSARQRQHVIPDAAVSPRSARHSWTPTSVPTSTRWWCGRRWTRRLKTLVPNLTLPAGPVRARRAWSRGRCPRATREVMISPDTWRPGRFKVGDPLTLSWAINDPTNGWVPVGRPDDDVDRRHLPSDRRARAVLGQPELLHRQSQRPRSHGAGADHSRHHHWPSTTPRASCSRSTRS